MKNLKGDIAEWPALKQYMAAHYYLLHKKRINITSV
jgi:hypothetical protein